jgi:hypothetical protein
MREISPRSKTTAPLRPFLLTEQEVFELEASIEQDPRLSSSLQQPSTTSMRANTELSVAMS